MAKNLSWPQARNIARNELRAVRRDAWRKWLYWRLYVYLISEPVVSGDPPRAGERVVQDFDFATAEFLASDWTDEPWDGGSPPPPPPPGTGGSTGGGTTGGGTTGGGGSGGGSGSGGSGGGSGGSGGSGGGGGSGGPPGPHGPSNPGANAPTVTVNVTAPYLDAQPGDCLDQGGTTKLVVEVSISGGPSGVGTLGAGPSGGADVFTSTAFDGFTTSFEVEVNYNPGSSFTYAAKYRPNGLSPDAAPYTGSGTFKFPPACLIFTATFTGSMSETQRCHHGSGSDHTDDGFDRDESYGFTATYKTTPGAGTKTAQLTAAQGATGTVTGHFTPLNGSTQDYSYNVSVPGSLGVTVDQNGGVSNPSPAKLNILGSGGSSSDSQCTWNKTTNESISV